MSRTVRGKTLITVCNLKPANMRGVKSFAMVLCVRPSSPLPLPLAEPFHAQASSKDGKDGGIEFVEPPAGSLPGERVYFEGLESQTALDLLNPKRKIFETVQPGTLVFFSRWSCPDEGNRIRDAGDEGGGVDRRRQDGAQDCYGQGRVLGTDARGSEPELVGNCNPGLSDQKRELYISKALSGKERRMRGVGRSEVGLCAGVSGGRRKGGEERTGANAPLHRRSRSEQHLRISTHQQSHQTQSHSLSPSRALRKRSKIISYAS